MPPTPGAVAERAVALLGPLGDLVEIEIYGDRLPGQATPLAGAPLRHWLELPRHAAACDGLLYQIGDDPACRPVYELLLHQPGIVELHDAALGGLYFEHYYARGRAAHYASKIDELHGGAARALVPALRRGLGGTLTPRALPLLREVVDAAVGLVLHDEATRRRLRPQAPSTPMLIASPDDPVRAARAVAAFVLALAPLWRRRLEAALDRAADARVRLVNRTVQAAIAELPSTVRAAERWSAAAEECFGSAVAQARGRRGA